MANVITSSTTNGVTTIASTGAKSGWKTSEFYVVILSQAVPIILMLWGSIPAPVMVQMMAVSGVLAGIFAGLRSYAKSTASRKDDELFNKLVQNKVVAILAPILNKLGINCDPIEIIKEEEK